VGTARCGELPRPRPAHPRVPRADPRGAAPRQDRQHRQRRGPGRQPRRDRLRGHEGRADRVHQVTGQGDGPLPDQRQLRVPRPDRHPAVRHTAREGAGGADPRHPVPQARHPRGGPTRCCSSPPVTRTSSPARS
jgi:hypothetical protein